MGEITLSEDIRIPISRFVPIIFILVVVDWNVLFCFLLPSKLKGFPAHIQYNMVKQLLMAGIRAYPALSQIQLSRVMNLQSCVILGRHFLEYFPYSFIVLLSKLVNSNNCDCCVAHTCFYIHGFFNEQIKNSSFKSSFQECLLH